MPSPQPGPVELCVGDCSADFRTQSEQLYSFVVCGVAPPGPSPLPIGCVWDGPAEPSLPASGPLLPQTPTFDRVSPARGPASGGTRLTITGHALDAGSSVMVTVRDGECQFVRWAGQWQAPGLWLRVQSPWLPVPSALSPTQERR